VTSDLVRDFDYLCGARGRDRCGLPRYAGDGWTLKAEPPQRDRSLPDSDARAIRGAIASTDWKAGTKPSAQPFAHFQTAWKPSVCRIQKYPYAGVLPR
jgi:hypothetical protein